MKKVLMIAATLMMAALVSGPVMAQGGMGGFQMPPELTKAMDKMRTARKNRMMIGRTVRAIAMTVSVSSRSMSRETPVDLGSERWRFMA